MFESKEILVKANNTKAIFNDDLTYFIYEDYMKKPFTFILWQDSRFAIYDRSFL